MTSSKQQSKWNDWSSINLDDFREKFPNFRQTEITAIEQIISGNYKQHVLNDQSNTAQYVFNIFKNDPETVQKADIWFNELQKKNKIKNETLITPTIIGPKPKN